MSVLEKLYNLLPFKNIEKGLVNVIRINGAIGQGKNTSSALESTFKRAFFSYRKPEIVAIVINSPGGSAAQSYLIANRIRQLSEESKIPTISFSEDMSASGGYMLLSAANEAYALNSSLVGSIGVIYSSFGGTNALDKLGIERRVITAGTNKSFLDPFKPLQDKDKEVMEEILKVNHDDFINIVEKHREDKLVENHDLFKDIYTGRIFTGKVAKELGLIDGIDDIHSYFNKKFGDEYKLREIKRELSLSDLRGSFGLGIESITSPVLFQFQSEKNDNSNSEMDNLLKILRNYFVYRN